MTSLHHHHRQHHQELNKTMQQHQATHQHGGMLLERRIIQLLTETNLTFKEIVIKLEGENLCATIGMIRRINRDNRYRRPRYDSKLTPSQRDSLVEELRDHKGMKPNLSLLAKRYGVCHGSVWYWWDKLNRIKRSDPLSRGNQVGGAAASSATAAAAVAAAAAANGVGGKLCVGKTELQIFTANARTYRRRPMKGDGLGGGGANQAAGSSHGMAGALRWRGFNNILLDERYNYVGRVSIVGRSGNVAAEHQAAAAAAATSDESVCCPIDLPILMFARKELAEEDSVKTSVSSGSLDLSPSPVVVVDDSYEEDEGDEEDDEVDDGLEFGDSQDGPSSLMLPLGAAVAAASSTSQQVGLASGSL